MVPWRALFLTVATHGHVNPYIGVAHWVRRLGGLVSWACIPNAEAYVQQLAAHGVDVVRTPDAPNKMVRDPLELVRIVKDDERNRSRFEAYLNGGDADVARLRSAIRETRPDVIALDASVYISVVAALCERVPFVNACTTLVNVAPSTLVYPYVALLESIATTRDALFARHGVTATIRHGEALSPLANLIFSTQSVVGDPPTMLQLVGPSISPIARGDEIPIDWSARDGRPLVYISFGSMIYWQPELLTLLARAAAAAGGQPLLSAGTLASDDAFRRGLPDGTMVFSYVPQMEALSRAALFVSHGGANSFMEAMYQGVPVLILPMCHDQPVQAYFANAAGVGLAAEPSGLELEAAVALMTRLLDPNSSHSARAREVRDSYRAADGARAIATLLRDVAS